MLIIRLLSIYKNLIFINLKFYIYFINISKYKKFFFFINLILLIKIIYFIFYIYFINISKHRGRAAAAP